MSDSSWFVEILCPRCAAARVLNEAEVVRTLQQQGMLRRAGNAEESLLLELLTAAGPKLTCAQCAAQGLVVRELNEPSAGWGERRACAQCGSAISLERLEALPDVTLCAACQGHDDRGGPVDAPEYCRHCGAILQMRQVAGRVTRYALKCPECGR